MIDNDTLKEICKAAAVAGFNCRPKDMKIDVWKSGLKTHLPSKLPAGFAAVYVYERKGVALKVGQCGGKSPNTAYQYRHYNLKHMSTLAKSVLKDNKSVTRLNEKTVSDWIKKNTTRYNILIPVGHHRYFRSFVEAYLILKLKPKVELYGDR